MMDSIRTLILQKVFSQCAKMLDPTPGSDPSNLKPHTALAEDLTSGKLPIHADSFDNSNLEEDGDLGINTSDQTLWKRVSSTDIREITNLSEFFENSSNVKWLGGSNTDTSYAETGTSDINSDAESKTWLDDKYRVDKLTLDSPLTVYFWSDGTKLRRAVTLYSYDYPNPESEYFRHFKEVHDRYDFGLSEPGAQDELVITEYIKFIRFGTCRLVDLHKQDLLPALFIEAGTNSHAQNFRGIELAKEGELMAITLRLWTKEQQPSKITKPAYRYSNPIYVAQIREQLDYLLDRNEFIGISMPRTGYTLPSQVHDCSIGSVYTLQGIRAPFEGVDIRFEVLFDKQIEIDDRYAT